MVIGIDASRVWSDGATGTENVSSALIRALVELPQMRQHELRLYAQQALPEVLLAFDHVQQRRVASGRPWLWKFSRLLKKEREELDVLFVPSHVVPFWTPRRVVTILHGMEWYRLPHTYSALEQQRQFFATQRAVKTCETIVTPSEATANGVRDWARELRLAHQLPPIEVIPHGPISLQQPSVRPPALEGEMRPVFVTIGRQDVRKNLPTLIRAHVRAFPYSEALLVLAGGEGSGTRQLNTVLQEEGNPDSVVVLGRVSEPEKTWLLKNAAAFVSASVEEGFGLPLLEAFQAECLPIVSAISAYREVAGDAALFVESQDVEAWSEVLRDVHETKSAQYSEILRAGRERLQQFSWKTSAERVAAVLCSS